MTHKWLIIRGEKRCSSGGRRSTALNTRHQTSRPGGLLVHEQVVRLSNGGMGHHEGRPNQQSHQNVDRCVGQQQQHHRQRRHHDQNKPIINRAAENSERLVPQEVQGEPRCHDYYEHDERDWVPEQAEEEDQQNYDRVVRPEVDEIGSGPGERMGEARREPDRPNVEHLHPWTAVRKA